MPVPTYGTSHKRFNITKAKNAMYMPANTSLMDPPKLGASPSMRPGGQTLPSKASGKMDWAGMATDVVPYISNIVNSFRKPPMIKNPNTVSKPTAVRINLDSTRNEVRRKLRSSDLAASRTLDENSAAAVRAGNMAIGLNQLGQVNESEANANAQLAGQNRQMGLQTDMYNSSVMNKYNDDVVNRGLAETRFQQQNIADAADKFMGQTAQRDVAKLDKEKAQIYSTMFENSGVWNREIERLKKMGIDVSKYGMKMYGGKMKKYADGGDMMTGPGDPPTRVPRQKLEEWNSFIGYMDTKKIDPQLLNQRDKSLGKTYLEEWRKTNPNVSLSYDDVAPIQEEFKRYREYAIGQHKAGKLKMIGDPGPNYEKFMSELSEVDGWLGSKTYRRFPNEYLTSVTPEQTTKKNLGIASMPAPAGKSGLQKAYGGMTKPKRRKL
jgi:hypothetical protein